MLVQAVVSVGGRRSSPGSPRVARALLLLLWLPLLLLVSVDAHAQEGGADAVAAVAAAGPIETAPVVVDGETLFRVRGISAVPAAERAQGIASRIMDLARDPEFTADAIEVVESDILADFRYQGRRIFVIVDADAELEGVARGVLIEAYKPRIAEAVQAFRADRKPRALLQNSLAALTAAAALVLAVGLLLWISRRIMAALERTVRKSVERVKIQRFQLLPADRVWSGVLALTRLLRTASVLVLVFVFVQFVLALFPWTRLFSRRLNGYVTEPLSRMAEAVVDFVPNLFFLILVALVTRFALRTIHLFFAGTATGRVKLATFDPEWSWPTYRIVRILVIAFGLVIAFPYLPGSDSGAFRGVSIFLGLIFSLGSTSVIANVIAGYTMTYRRAFRIGDRVRIGDVVGDVVLMRLLVTHLRTAKNEEVVVPNSMILNQQIVNYSSLSREHGLIVHTSVGIGYEVPWRQVEALLLQAARATPGTVDEPAPFVLQKRLGDYAIEYEINVACAVASQMQRVLSDLHRHVLDEFNEYGVAIMTPSYEADPPDPKIVPKERWFEAPAERDGDADTSVPRD